ncbi:MAG: rRNA maturation RNase YbeY [Treponema sp.]|nr:rRNA maturation RNase YbeY [Treponema sp.]
MNRVAVSASGVPLPQWSKPLKSYVRKVLEKLGKDKWDISILLCGDAAISELNSRYRGKEGATDVLSFSQNEGEQFPGMCGRCLIGDIGISLETLRENASRFNISEDEELRRLLIHGILHLSGMNHLSNGKAEAMLQLQERVLTDLAGERIVGRGA